MATAQKIRESAAEILGQLGEGQTLESAITTDLNQAYIEVYAELQGLDLVPWALADEVPDRFAASVAMLVANNRAVKYRVPPEQYARIVSEGWGLSNDGKAIKTIIRLQTPAKVAPTKMENF